MAWPSPPWSLPKLPGINARNAKNSVQRPKRPATSTPSSAMPTQPALSSSPGRRSEWSASGPVVTAQSG